ncbi:MAG: hydroxymethylglutaryl-CoA lyase, partial [Alphaproteobacteria bacterium]
MVDTERVELIEVGPRDGLQNEPTTFSTAAKLALIGDLLEAGMRRMQVAS